MSFRLTDEQVAAFHHDGYIIVPGLFDAEETRMVRDAARGDDAMADSAMDILDKAGKTSKLALWNHPGDDIFGMVARCHRVVDTAEALLDDEVYHYHSKLSMKEPKVGGAWEWHRDYGYWYQNGCLFPDMLSCMIALDPATKENGCMQVIKGSHKLGRIEHGFEVDQTGADKKRVADILKVLDLDYAVLDAGDALFFHGNTLHCSAPNESEHPRWVMISCYNTKHNNPTKKHHHPFYTKLEKVADETVREYGQRRQAARRDYVNTRDDETTAAGKS